MDSDITAAYNDDTPAPSAALAHFRSVPWTAKYLASSDYRLAPTSSRYLKATGEDAFFALTINTPTTIPYCLSLCPPGIELSQASSRSPVTTPTFSTSSKSPAPTIFDYVWLLHLAEPGINGHPKTAHGGVLASILDELIGVCAISRQPDRSIPLYTAKLQTTYKAPVLVPSNVVCTSWLTRKEGRKYWVRAQILDENETVMTEGEALLVESKTKQKL
jgi:Thioesterase superfamily